MNTKGKITYSSDDGKITRKDIVETSRITEEYFGTDRDPDQIPTTAKNRDWIYGNVRDYLNIIRSNGKIIGYAFALPCNNRLMEDFIKDKISEAELFERIKKIKFDVLRQFIFVLQLLGKNLEEMVWLLEDL